MEPFATINNDFHLLIIAARRSVLMLQRSWIHTWFLCYWYCCCNFEYYYLYQCTRIRSVLLWFLLISIFYSWYISMYRVTLSWRRPLLYRNQSIDLPSKSLDWFLHDNNLRHERVKYENISMTKTSQLTSTCSKS